ncbi:hypothetical protein KXR87_15320, partial [Yokenella regensburgei]|uniref:hypothetical protein n=1 Tax=Yokenella regensburgei TaxID=158877 RepID=UPI003F136E67
IFAFLCGLLSESHRNTLLTRRRVCRCSVSVEAHYRELFRADKSKIQKTFQPSLFSTSWGKIEHNGANLLFLPPQRYTGWHTNK